jgi:hypothetical protein
VLQKQRLPVAREELWRTKVVLQKQRLPVAREELWRTKFDLQFHSVASGIDRRKKTLTK